MVCPPFPFFFFVMCFIKFWHVARKPIWGCVWQSWTFWKNVFWFIKLKNWLNIWSLLFIEFVLWMFIICCVPAQIPYLEKILVLRCGSKCFSANQIAWFYNQLYPDFLHAGTYSEKLKLASNDFWARVVKNGQWLNVIAKICIMRP